MGNISAHSHAKTTGKSFEDTFYLVMLILTFSLDVEIHASAVRKALEEMHEHLSRHLTYPLAMKLRVPNQPWASSKIQCHLTQAIIHGETIAIALYSTFVTQCLHDAFSQCEPCVFNGMMFIHIKISIAADIEVHHTMLGYLLQHVIEKSQTRLDITFPIAIQIDAYMNVSLFGSTSNLEGTLTCKDEFCYFPLIHSRPQDKTLAAKICGKLSI